MIVIGISPRGRDEVSTTNAARKFPRATPSPRRQIPLIPGDSKLTVALRALHVEGVARDGRAGAADGADRVASAPMVRQVPREIGRAHV